MIAQASGIGGSLFPGRYLADRLLRDADPLDERSANRVMRELPRWWARVEASCGPATGLRALFDLAAMPLFGLLGFRASRAVFERTSARVLLRTPTGTPVALVILPWANKPSGAWRSAVESAGTQDASWCFLLAPPFLTLMPARGSAIRRSVEFVFPEVCRPESLLRFLSLAHAGMFDEGSSSAAPIDRLITSGAAFQDRVRVDLQHGVIRALEALTPVITASPAKLEEKPFAQALTVLYRILFLLFAESRGLMPGHHPIYRDTYAIDTLCRQAAASSHTTGLWDALAAVTRLSRSGCRVEDLVVPAFNGRLFARAAAPALESGRPLRRSTAGSVRRDGAMQLALVSLATRPTAAGREEISYADLGVEQLGAVYERVLELDAESRDRRKKTGTFYTPQDLTEFVVRRTLSPLVTGRSADEILALRVVDPAMGSGAFLVAACRYLAAAYEGALIEDGRCGAADLGPADRAGLRRLVAERCLAGVDVNPIAVQLARLSLWLATLSAGKPLGFLDHRLRVGNSLVGAWPDDLRYVGSRQRAATAPLPLFDHVELEYSVREAVRPLWALLDRRDDTVADVRAKEAIWARLSGDRSPLAPWRQAADLWCARWFSPPDQPPVSAAELRAAIDGVLRGDATLSAAHLARLLHRTAALQRAHRFFHWPLEFADVFYQNSGQPKPRPGFDAVIGNPPWEMLRNDGRLPGAGPDGSARTVLRFVRECAAYPSCARGQMNLYQPFVERALRLTRPGGRIGLILPWGLASDDGAAALRRRLLSQTSLDTAVGFDNAHGIFPIHRGLRFLAMVTTAGGRTEEFSGRFGVKTLDEIRGLPGASIRVSQALIERVGGRTSRIPDARRSADLNLLEQSTAAFPRLGSSAGWNVQFGRELNVTEDRASFGDRGLPVLEGKHVHPFVAATETGLRIPRDAAERLLPSGGFTAPRLAYRDVAGVTNRWSLIAAIVPKDVVTTHTLFCLRTKVPIDRQHFLCGLFNSYVLNAMVRMLMGTHLTTSLIEDLPVPVWIESSVHGRVADLAARCSRQPAHPRTGALLQALVARLYGLDRPAFAEVLTGFPLVPAAERGAALRAFERIAEATTL